MNNTTKIPLNETFDFKPIMVESSDNGLLKVRGIFQRYDKVNANGRFYSKKIFEKILGSQPFQDRLKKRGIVGILEHPEDGQTRLDRISHVVTKVWDDGKGLILGECEVLDTTNGKELKSLFHGNVMVGISSRGSGSVTEKDGVQHVNEDYECETWDFVYNNSVESANPIPVESTSRELELAAVNERTDTTDDSIKEDQLKMGKLMEMKKLKREISSLVRTPVDVPFDQRATLIEDIDEKRVELDRLVSEDASIKSIADKVHKDLNQFESKVNDVETGKDGVKDDYDALKKISEGVIEQNKELKDQIVALGSKIEELENKSKGSRSEGVMSKRYSALKKICEELMRRVHGANKLAESSLKKARQLRKSATESKDAKRYPVARKIIERMRDRYHADTLKLFKAGFLTKYPGAKVYERKLNRCKTLKEATKLSKKIIKVLEKNNKAGKQPVVDEGKSTTDKKRSLIERRKQRRKEPLPGKNRVRIPESGSQSETENDVHESVNMVRRARQSKKKRGINS